MKQVQQQVDDEVQFDLRAELTTEDHLEIIDRVDMNEFTICGKAWDQYKLAAFFKGDTTKAMAVWTFMESVGEGKAHVDFWKSAS